jgi:hypothetical protein
MRDYVRCVRYRFSTHTVGSEIAQYLLSRSHFLRKVHRIEFFILPFRMLFDSGVDAVVRQKPIARRRRREVDLVHACSSRVLDFSSNEGWKKLMYSRDDAYSCAKAFLASMLLSWP